MIELLQLIIRQKSMQSCYPRPDPPCTKLKMLVQKLFKNKYDYRDLWIKSSEIASGSQTLQELLPRFGEFIAKTMFVKQVGIWLRSENTQEFKLAHVLEPPQSTLATSTSLGIEDTLAGLAPDTIFSVSGASGGDAPLTNKQIFQKLQIQRIVLLATGETILGILGVGADASSNTPTQKDDQLLRSLSKQLAHPILNHRLSEELTRARQWESFNRFSSFIVHDLKNLATLQSMTLENAKSLTHNPEFVADAFATFAQTTDNIMSLIATLSVQRGQLSLKQEPVNIASVIRNTLDDLKVVQRSGIKLVSEFPQNERTPMTFGDPELLKKAFANVLLNAIQSLPSGEGRIQILMDDSDNGKVSTAITDTGCGIPPEQLEKIFQPFQSTRKTGSGIGLCHTRSIVEIHGGSLRIKSGVNSGTRVEIVLPCLNSVDRRETNAIEV